MIVQVLVIFGGMLLAGVMTTKLASRIGVPALVLFIAVGMIIGSDISGWIYFDDAWMAQLVGTIALIIILVDGGLHTDWRQMRAVTTPSVSLATLGVVITVAITGLLARVVLNLDWPLALLLGAIVGSTDAAAVFAVIGNQNIPGRLKATVEAESGLNDPMAVFLTILMMEWVQQGPPNGWEAAGFLVWQMGLGLALGLLFGWIAGKGLAWLKLEASGLYPILLFATAIFVFGLTSWLNGSGLVAVYVMAIRLGSVEMPYRASILRFHEGMAWLSQMVMFILLGLLVFPSHLPPVIIPGLILAAGLMLVARPVAVWLSTLGMGFSVRERVLLAWSGLRGAVPVILATYPLLAGLPQSNMIFNVVFFVVLSSALIQGATIAPVARWLGLVEGSAPPRVVTLELVAMEKLNADLIEVVLPPGSDVVGKRLTELQLPEQATVSALLRAGRVVAPRGSTRLQAGDTLFVLTGKEQTPSVRAMLEGV
jgi:potassium/hydrogen antiporter